MQTICFVEYQLQKDGSVLTDDKTKKTIRPGEHAQEDEMNVKSAFLMKCASAAISKCECHTVKAVDYKGDVWEDCSMTFLHPQPETTQE